LIPLLYPWEEVTFKKKKDKALEAETGAVKSSSLEILKS